MDGKQVHSCLLNFLVCVQSLAQEVSQCLTAKSWEYITRERITLHMPDVFCFFPQAAATGF